MFTRSRIVERLRAAPAPGIRRGDQDLNPDMEPKRPLIPAAVLVPLVERQDGLTVLLTRRTDHLHDHAGQISFPGGRIDAADADAIAAALRETEEEVGLPRDRVEIAGRLDTYITRTGFEVTPVIGLVTPPEAYAPDPFEVAEVFEVPLSFIAAPGSAQRQSREFQGRTRSFYVFPWQGYFIWGATAGMLVNLADILRQPD
ncbi:MAG TPA: CoA pyrophosphatase [Dongiaceae bacterium]